MISKLRGRVSSAHVIALAALFVALGGTAFAAATIGTKDIKNGAVTAKKLHKKAVTAKKIKNHAVKAKKIGDEAVHTGQLANLAVTSPKIAVGAVGTDKLAGSSGRNATEDDARLRDPERAGQRHAQRHGGVSVRGPGDQRRLCHASGRWRRGDQDAPLLRGLVGVHVPQHGQHTPRGRRQGDLPGRVTGSDPSSANGPGHPARSRSQASP